MRALAAHQCGPGWVCCWFSPLLQVVFPWVLQFSSRLKHHFFKFQFDLERADSFKRVLLPFGRDYKYVWLSFFRLFVLSINVDHFSSWREEFHSHLYLTYFSLFCFSGCNNTTFNLCTPTRPVILPGNEGLLLAPYHTHYPALEEHLHGPWGVPIEPNLWNDPLILGETWEWNMQIPKGSSEYEQDVPGGKGRRKSLQREEEPLGNFSCCASSKIVFFSHFSCK